MKKESKKQMDTTINPSEVVDVLNEMIEFLKAMSNFVEKTHRKEVKEDDRIYS